MLGCRRILIVDDEINLRKTLGLILSKAGYDVAQAMDADSANRILRTKSFSLIFLDLRLPDVDGLDLLASIHISFPNTSVIVLTGYPSIESETTAWQKGASGYLKKPVDPAQILDCVQEILKE